MNTSSSDGKPSKGHDLRRQIPSVTALLTTPSIGALLAEQKFGRDVIVTAVRAVLSQERSNVKGGAEPKSLESLGLAVTARVEKTGTPHLRPAVNATGIVLHTNLGRAVLAPQAVDEVLKTAAQYSTLEFDVVTGRRGSRSSLVEDLIREVTGAEAALVVNNNAGAVFLFLRALAQGRDVLVSRGELVEIGGSFRVPDVMAESGARLVEVGTTNRTRIEDYRRGLTPDTAAVLKAHRSNFHMSGFVTEVTPRQLVELARDAHVLATYDLGSGYLWGGAIQEPTVVEAVQSGMDVISFSGDKLLGGPQAGIILGRASAVERIRRHPLARALRPGKLTFAALEATLRLYRDHRDHYEAMVPVLSMLALTQPVLARRATSLARGLRAAAGEWAKIGTRQGVSEVGGGSAPETALATQLVSVRPTAMSVDELARRLRCGAWCVVARIGQGELWLDPRTLQWPKERSILVQSLRVALSP